MKLIEEVSGADWEDLQTLKWAQTVDPHQSEECELLLETYSMQVSPLNNFASLCLILYDLMNLQNLYGFVHDFKNSTTLCSC